MLTALHPCLFIVIAAYLGWRFGGPHPLPACAPAYASIHAPLCYLLIAGVSYGVMYWAMLFYMNGAMILMQVRSTNAAMCAFPLQCLYPH